MSMAVYVDALNDWGWKHGPSCHLIADSENELHVFALAIGMKREWFQPKTTPHYDLSAGRRQKALDLGAIALDRSAFVDKLRSLRAAAKEKKWKRDSVKVERGLVKVIRCMRCAPAGVEMLLLGILNGVCEKCGMPGRSPDLGAYWVDASEPKEKKR